MHFNHDQNLNVGTSAEGSTEENVPAGVNNNYENTARIESDPNINPSVLMQTDPEKERKIKICFAVTNARSLWKKIQSMYDAFTDLELDFMIVSETWFHNTPALDRLVCDAEHGKGVKMINYCRTKRGRLNAGGGISIIYNSNTLTGSEYNVKKSGFEIAVGKFKLKNESRALFIIGAYLSTRLSKQEAEKNIQALVVIINKIKLQHESPYIVLGGDFNNFDISSITTDFIDLILINTHPTRRNRTIDLAICNVPVVENEVYPPLHNDENDSDSDHRIVFFKAEWKHSHKFRWIKTRHRDLREDNVNSCVQLINAFDWQQLCHGEAAGAAEALHTQLSIFADRTIPWKTSKRRSTDKPWVDNKTRKKMCQRRAVYRDRGRDSIDWKELKDKTDDMLETSKKKWYNKETEKLMAKGSNQLPYKALRHLGTVEFKEEWDIMDTRPGKSEAQVADELAVFYTQIAEDHQPLTDQDIPKTYDREQIIALTDSQVAERLKSIKKPRSYVSIDLPPGVVNQTADALAPILAYIINGILRGEEWPRIWKSEEVITIPKTKRPETFDQCRGISCTSIYSKMAETFMLDILQDEIGVGLSQFGGLKGVGTDHIMSELLTKTLEDLDDCRGAVTVMSVDYKKAFNHMNYRQCLLSMAKKGSSNQALKIAAGFLRERSIRTKVGDTYSSNRPLRGGAPQGTKSGNFFFTISIDEVECELTPSISEIHGEPGREDVQEAQAEGTEHNEVSTPSSSGTRIADQVSSGNDSIANDERSFDPDSSFNVARTDLRQYRSTATDFLNDTVPDPGLASSQDDHELALGFPGGWKNKPTWAFKYVDDVTLGGRNLLDHATRHITTGKERRTIHAGALQKKFETVYEKSKELGMKINPDKTQLICISPAINYEVKSFVRIDGEIINSSDTLKILGFTLDTKCTLNAHLTTIKTKFAKRVWVIRHLKRAKLEEGKLVRVYCSFIRPCLEYLCATFNGMLNSSQSKALERMQSIALKTVFGWNKSYRQCLEESGLQTLAARRYDICLNFAKKTEANPRFSHWFPPNDQTPYDLRNSERIHIDFAKHERLRRSPIHHMRRLLNDQVQPEDVSFEDLDGC